MNNPFEIRKVIGGVVLTLLWLCTFLFVSSTLVIDWAGDGRGTLTPLKPIIILIGLFILVLYHILYKSSPETNKLSWTSVLTLSWLSLILFYPFKDPANYNGGAVGFFALIGGLAVCVLWVRFFSDEIVA
ncbi:hypothetical protein [Tengunoibacter tsumagoiensis]|uniref:Uncharacterized protein n=1 Tax=Tengunoibacter tsumagoiensis TaxID=2014871 RepID=A0A401ZTW9_9CHLR|nr:hypothetical protein [Tengunoibacter tsumagoiensis]GCE10252.1 hypothetical protein KTT_01110 [Tengunoibacter tsumagoiensis]